MNPNDQAVALSVAEQLAVRVLQELSPGCAQTKLLAGNTKRGPAFLYACGHCGSVSVISVPVGGLRDRDPGDPTSRTRIASFSHAAIAVETGAFIESDGTVRARLAIHLPGHPEPEWDLTADSPAAVGEVVRVLRELPVG